MLRQILYERHVHIVSAVRCKLTKRRTRRMMHIVIVFWLFWETVYSTRIEQARKKIFYFGHPVISHSSTPREVVAIGIRTCLEERATFKKKKVRHLRTWHSFSTMALTFNRNSILFAFLLTISAMIGRAMSTSLKMMDSRACFGAGKLLADWIHHYHSTTFLRFSGCYLFHLESNTCIPYNINTAGCYWGTGMKLLQSWMSPL